MLTSRAPAKVNLCLHILGRQEDGYHELESLVVFAGVHDVVGLEPQISQSQTVQSQIGLTVDGPFTPACGALSNNLIVKAARAFETARGERVEGQFHLLKRLPTGGGLGGGSSDAAATLRLLAEVNSVSVHDPVVSRAAESTGADVLVCLEARARIMRGVGERLGPALSLPPLFAVLINPGVHVATQGIFQALGLSLGQRAHAPVLLENTINGCSFAQLVAVLTACRNDLEAPATAEAPVIGEALSLIRSLPNCVLARMSGSGSTVFGLFETCHQAARAARLAREAQPDWWIRPTWLGSARVTPVRSRGASPRSSC